MKLFEKISVLFVLSLVLLAGCNSSFEKEEPEQQLTQEVTEVTYECEDLNNEISRENCFSEIEDVVLNELNNEILSTFDLNRCAELSQEMADECEAIIQESGVEGPISDDQVVALEDALSLSYETSESEEDAEGVAYYDKTKCASLTAKGLKEYCEKQIDELIEEEKMIEIIQDGDTTKCDELENETFRERCRIELGILTDATENIEDEGEPTPNDMGIILDSEEPTPSDMGIILDSEEPITE